VQRGSWRPSDWHTQIVSMREGTLVLHLTQVMNAPRERIFTAMTEPASVVQWWGPRGFSTPDVELDPRVGGGYRYSMQPPDGELFHLSGSFLDVEAPARLSYTFAWEEPDPDDRETIVTVSLAEAGDATEVSVTQGVFATEARLALHRDGWTDSLDKLRELFQPGAA
jgi:uncharacterized protein YndB with AHSA1/START domain